MKSRILAFVSLLAALCLVFSTALAADFRPWNKQESYQYVYFGRYPQETIDHTEEVDGQTVNVWAADPVCWQVLDVFPEEDVVWMITQYVLDGHCVVPAKPSKNKKEKVAERFVETYQDSDLYAWMNSDVVDTMFTPEEQAVLDTARGKLFILTNVEMIDQYGWPKYIDDIHSAPRMSDATSYALERGIYHGPFKGAWGATYWCDRLRGGKGNQMMQIVGFDGHESWAGVTRTNVGIRPAIRVKMSEVEIVSGAGTREAPFVIAPIAGTAAAE